MFQAVQHNPSTETIFPSFLLMACLGRQAVQGVSDVTFQLIGLLEVGLW